MPEVSAISRLEQVLIQQESARYMPDFVGVFTRAPSRSSSGGSTYTISTTPSVTGRGRLAPMDQTQEEFYADRLGGRQGWTITLPENIAIPAPALTALFRVGSREFELIGSDTVRSFQLTRRYDCVEKT